MRVTFMNEVSGAGRIPRSAFLSLASRAARTVPGAGNRTIAVGLVSAATSKRLNQTYRKKNRPTNVLSFESPNAQEELGDIIICPAVARREAREMGVGFNRWASYLFVHGLLHLAGFGHETAKNERAMEAAARRILGDLYPFSD